jgi:hypothetical protein
MLDSLIRDARAFNRSMNDPDDWRKRRKIKLEEYDLPKIAAEGLQNIEKQKIANMPEMAKQKWESSDQYFEKQQDLISEKNRPEMLTARTNAGYKDYLTGSTKHARDIENTMAEQVYQIRTQDRNAAAVEAEMMRLAESRDELAKNPAYGGYDPNVRVAGLPGTTAPNMLESEVPLMNPEDPYSWSSSPRPQSVATIPETSKIDSFAGTGPTQRKTPILQSRPAAYYDRYLGAQQQLPEQSTFDKYGTAPAPDSYLAEWGLKNKRNQRRRNRDLYED